MRKFLMAGALVALSPLGLGADEGDRAQILKDLEAGRQHLEAGRFEEAERSFTGALRLTEARENGRVAVRERLSKMIESARKQKETHDRELESMRRQQAMRLAYNDIERRQKFHKAKVEYLTRQIERYVEAKDYDKAARLSRDILSLDPNNAKLKHFLQFSSHEAERARERSVKETKRREARRLELAMDEDYILQSDTMTFPEDFDKKTRTREQVETPPEPEWKTDLKNRMRQKVSFNLVNMPFDDVLKHLESVYELPIIVEGRVREEIFADGTAPVDLRSKGMTIEAALRWIVEPLGVRVAYKNGAVYLTEDSDLSEDKNTLVYDVRDLAHVPPDYIGPEISLAGGEEGGGGIAIEQTSSEMTDTTDPEDLVRLIEAMIESYEAQYKR